MVPNLGSLLALASASTCLSSRILRAHRLDEAATSANETCYLDAAEVLCKDGDMSVVAMRQGDADVRSMRYGEACGVETEIRCKGGRDAGLCGGSCSTACPCEYDLEHGLNMAPLEVMSTHLETLCRSEQPSSLLMIGLGGGVMPQHLLGRCPSMQMEAVEIDGKVIKMARHYFGIGEAEAKYKHRLRIDEADGHQVVLSKGNATFDAVLVDCFQGKGLVPEACRSKSFAEGIRRILKPSGVMMQNIWSDSPYDSKIAQADFHQAVSTYRTVFTEKAVEDLHVPGYDFGHVLKCTAVEL